MKDFELDDVPSVNAGKVLVAYDSVEGTALFALEQQVNYDDMSDEQKEFAHTTAQRMWEHPKLNFMLGEMEEIDDLADMDLPVIVWSTLRGKETYYDPVDIADAREYGDGLSFYKLV